MKWLKLRLVNHNIANLEAKHPSQLGTAGLETLERMRKYRKTLVKETNEQDK